MLNLTEPIVTRRQQFPVELYCIGVQDSSPYTLHGAFYVPSADRWFVMAWTEAGEMTPGEQSDLDLMNPSPSHSQNPSEPALPLSSAQAPAGSLPPLSLSSWEVV